MAVPDEATSTTETHMVRLVIDATMKDYIVAAKANNCEIEHDKEAGTIVMRDGDAVVLKGIAKGPSGPWLTRFTNSDRISWSGTEGSC